LTSRLERNRACRCDHTRFAVAHAPVPIRSYSLAKLIHDFAGATGDTSSTLTLGGVEWVERGVCRCPEPTLVQRFIPQGRGTAGRCHHCRATIQPQPFHTHQTVSAAMLGGAASVPLCMLGVRKSPWGLLRTATGAVLVRDPHRVLPLP
jgi:hypothetical protein